MFLSITRKGFIRKISALSILPFLSPGNIFSARTASPSLLTKKLGQTGIEVRAVGIGASRTQEPAIIKAALNEGINFFDTGRTYANGQNEEMLGKVFKGIRNEVIIQSKVQIPEANKLDNKRSRKFTLGKMEESVNASLKALQTDYIDIMLLHGMKETAVISHPAIIEFMQDLKAKGKIRAHGFSTHGNQAELTRWNNNNLGYDIIMPAFNHRGGYIHSVSGRKYDWDHEELIAELKKAHENQTGIVAMKTTSGGPRKDKETGVTTMYGAVKWVIQQDYISVAAVAMVNYEQIRENVRAMHS